MRALLGDRGNDEFTVVISECRLKGLGKALPPKVVSVRIPDLF
jgi:hypothetical protein